MARCMSLLGKVAGAGGGGGGKAWKRAGTAVGDGEALQTMGEAAQQGGGKAGGGSVLWFGASYGLKNMVKS